MRASILIVFAVVLNAAWTSAVSRTPTSQTEPQRPTLPAKPLPAFLKTQEWIQLAKAHRVGEVDDPVRALAGWSVGDLEIVDRDVHLIHYTISAAAMGLPGGRDAGGRSLQFAELPALLDLPLNLFPTDTVLNLPTLVKPESRTMAAVAKVMVQVAALQTDVALAAVGYGGSDLQIAQMPSNTIRVADADRARVPDLTMFWDAAREAMDVAAPTPWGGPVAHDWYAATTAYMISRRDYASGLTHAEHARLMVPGDASLALYLGAVYENMASPNIQAALEQLEVSALGARPALLSKAEYQFRSSLLLLSDSPVVWLRLGRTLQLASRNAEALRFLTRAEEGVGLPELQYCAALFSGLAYQSLQRDNEARAAFERAATLFPDAQTPKLAMAQMALRTSGQAEALVYLRSMNPAAVRETGSDPWWVYDIAVAPAAADRIDILLRSVREALR